MTQALSAALIAPPWADAVPMRRIDDNSQAVRIKPPISMKNEDVISLFEKRYAQFIEFRKSYDRGKIGDGRGV
jgi:hypothetical protein